jgi:transposase-like protein
MCTVSGCDGLDQTYSIDFRKKVLEIRAREKLSITKTAKRFGIGTTTIVNWLKNVVPKTTRNKSAVKIDMQELAEDVMKDPDSYQYERAMRFKVSIRARAC